MIRQGETDGNVATGGRCLGRRRAEGSAEQDSQPARADSRYGEMLKSTGSEPHIIDARSRDMIRKVVALTVVLWIGVAGVPAHAASSGGGSWSAAVIAWLTEAFSGGSEIQPDENGTIHVY